MFTIMVTNYYNCARVLQIIIIIIIIMCPILIVVHVALKSMPRAAGTAAAAQDVPDAGQRITFRSLWRRTPALADGVDGCRLRYRLCEERRDRIGFFELCRTDAQDLAKDAIASAVAELIFL